MDADKFQTGGRDQPGPDWTSLILVGTLGGLEAAAAFVLMVVDTPLSPIVRDLLQNPPGIFVFATSIATILFFSIAVGLWCLEWVRKRREANERAV